ncbi:MAG: response regulator [Bacteroidales bacterium]
MRSGNYKVLLVDDEQKNIQVLANALVPAGYEIEYALDGMKAIEWVRSEEFDLVLLDVMMPGINGYQVCQSIRLFKPPEELPVIFLTARVEKKGVIEGFRAGGSDYITKPFHAEELLARVATHINLRNAKKEIVELYEDTMESLRYARNIQKAILPSLGMIKKLLPESHMIYKQKELVGGDFYWIREMDGKIALIAGDSTGHGIPGAMMSMLGISIITNAFLAEGIPHPFTFLERVLHDVQAFRTDENFALDSIDFGLLVMDRDNRTVRYAASNFQMILASGSPKLSHFNFDKRGFKYVCEDAKGRHLEYLKSITGVSKSTDNLLSASDIRFRLDPGDRVYLFSDGVTDLFGGSGTRKLTRKGITTMIRDSLHLSLPEQGKQLEKALDQWKGRKNRSDDILLFCFEL